ncbi:MAG: tetratricopeptide repeat protein [Planctomycetes bacterium]|nr:tetratricopeptide repeat protein [Planctomycetota bacterium]
MFLMIAGLPDQGSRSTSIASNSDTLSNGDQRSWQGNLGLALAIVVATLLAYAPTLHNGFIWDDDGFLTKNPLIHSRNGLQRFWFSTEPPDYFPLTSSTLWLEWRLWGENATGYHVVNVLLHALSAILLWRLLLAMKIPGAWLAGLVFAVHPVNVESVAWITERKNVLPMVFYLLTLLAYLRFERRGSWGWYATALACSLLGLLAKTSIVTLPLVLLGWAWWERGKITGRDLLRAGPFFALSLGLGLVTVWYQKHVAIGSEIVRSDGWASRLATAGWAVWFYLYKALLPLNLSFVYPHWEVDPKMPFAWLPLAALLAVLALLLAFRRRPAARALLFALGYYLLMLLPVLGFVDIYFMRYSLVADHWQYFSILGVIVLVCAGWWQWQHMSQPFLAQAIAALLTLALGILTFQQSRIYANQEVLWNDVLAKNPDCWMAQNNLGVVLQRAGKTDEAVVRGQKALDLKPDYAEAHDNLALALQDLGRHDEALAHCQIAARLKPKDAQVHYNWGNVLRVARRAEEAVSQYEEALRINPHFVQAHNNLGNTLQDLGRFNEALSHFQQAARLSPDNAEIQLNWGQTLQHMGQIAEATRHLQAAIRLNPKNAAAYFNLGVIHANQGQFQAAITNFQIALRLSPNFTQARDSLQQAHQLLQQQAQPPQP